MGRISFLTSPSVRFGLTAYAKMCSCLINVFRCLGLLCPLKLFWGHVSAWPANTWPANTWLANTWCETNEVVECCVHIMSCRRRAFKRWCVMNAVRVVPFRWLWLHCISSSLVHCSPCVVDANFALCLKNTYLSLFHFRVQFNQWWACQGGKRFQLPKGVCK